MNVLQITSHSSEQTEALAKKLSASFVAGDLVVLSGPLGGGKTLFVRGLASGRGLSLDDVCSPTYTIVHEYRGEKPIYHFDLYRINGIDELKEIGWDEYLDKGGLMVVEWGEKADKLLPAKYYLITFEITGESERQIKVSLITTS